MKVQWKISDSAVDWARAAARLGGMDAGPFVDNLILYHAGGLDEREAALLEHHLALAEERLGFPVDVGRF